MPGDDTHGYDLALEISEEAIANVIATFWEDNDLACRLVQGYAEAVPGGLGSCEDFELSINFDRPADVQLPAGSERPVDIRLTTGDATVGTRTRMIVGLDVNRDAPELDIVQLNFRDRLYHASTKIVVAGAEQDFPGDEAAVIRDRIPPIAVVPVPVTRETTDCSKLTAADVGLVDEAGGQDVDALVVAMTAGGGQAGNLPGFTSSFIPAGSDAAIGVAFDWLCRCMSERLESELGLPDGSIEDCELQRSVRIDEEEDVDLVALSFTLEEGFIAVEAKVRKKGTCYKVEGTIKARLFLTTENGRLGVRSEVDDPDIDWDVPIWCWVIGGILFIGGIITGVLWSVVVGVIAAIIGAITLLVLWLIEHVVGGAIETIADAIKDALDLADANLEVPVPQMELVMDRVHIDDVTVGFQVIAKSKAGVRSEGELYVPDGYVVNLDTGGVAPADVEGGDLLWTGERAARALVSQCGAALSRTTSTRVDDLSRYQLRRLAYQSPVNVPFTELFNTIEVDAGPFEWRWDFPTFRVLAVRTNDERFSVVQAQAVTDDYLVLRYRTFERGGPMLRIDGDFECDFLGFALDKATAKFEPFTPTRRPRLEPRTPAGSFRSAVAAPRLTVPDAIAARPDLRAKAGLVTPGVRSLPGDWVGPLFRPRRPVGRFKAVAAGLNGEVTHEWAIERQRLTSAAGTVAVRGGQVTYAGADTANLQLRVKSGQAAVDFHIDVIATDEDGTRLRAGRCVRWQPTCQRWRPPIASLKDYRVAYKTHWGLRFDDAGPVPR